MKKICLLLAVLGMFVAFGCGSDGNSDPCVVGWSTPNFSCPSEAPVSCDQAVNCFVTLAECRASGQCTG